LRRWGDAIVTFCVALVVVGPAFASNSGVSQDVVNDLWLVRVQEHAFEAHAWPAYFVNASAVGVFYPLFIFYGGTLFAAVGALAAVSDHARAAFFASTGLAVIAAYGGMLWLARQLGVRSWRAHAPSITFVASAYYITNLWGRGDWPEFIATSMLPLLVASAWALASRPRIDPVPALLLVAATVLLAGSHNITLVLGALVFAALLIVLGIALGRDLAPCGPRRIAAIAGLLVLGVSIDAWFLLPDLLHAKQTRIGAGALTPAEETGFLNTPGVLFNPFRLLPIQSSTPALFVQAPDWFLFWVIAAGAMLWSRAGRALRRVTVALVVLAIVLLALIMNASLWDAMPTVVRAVQFPYRLNTYIALCASALVLVWVLALERTPSGGRSAALSVGLASAIAISALLAVWQVWYRPSAPTFYYNLNAANVPLSQVPPSFPPTFDYGDASGHVTVTAPTANIGINPADVSGNHIKVTVTPPPGTGPFATNISAGPYVALIAGGVARTGRTPVGESVVLRTSGTRGPVTISISRAGGSLTLGRIVSLVAIAIFLIVMIGLSGPRLWAWARQRSKLWARSRTRVDAVAADDRRPGQNGVPPREGAGATAFPAGPE
jgi:hypothetical protein